MKNQLRIGAAWAILMLSQIACKEINPTIPPLGPKDVGERKVLVEEFTGVTCVNCPNGSAKIDDLIAGSYGENLIAVSIHAGEFSIPYPDSRYDFRTPEGDALLTYLGEPLGYPTAVINRRIFPPSTELQNSLLTKWADNIQQVLAESPALSLTLATSYNAADRKLQVKATILPNQPIPSDARITVMITENNILDKQLTPEGVKSDYKHKHVLRKIITNTEGTQIVETLSVGQPIEKTFEYTFPTAWVAENCKVVAFVHRATATNKDVLQAEEAGLSQ